MKKTFLTMIILGFSILMVACSNDMENTALDGVADMATEESTVEREISPITGTNGEQAGNSEDGSAVAQKSEANRKVIYNANIHIKVKDYRQAVNDIQVMTSNRGGFVVESNMLVDYEGGPTNGYITARIPQNQLQAFIQFVEEGSSKVIESTISGEDVTEEYVDLESRLKSKHVVEARLLSFMEQAESTEDLLAISDNLATVQGEIEEITGRMKYLQNKADLATVTIYIQEENVTISGINEDELNTWERTTQQFTKSINLLLSTFSSLFIFLVGNIPVFILLGIIGFVVFLIARNRRRNN
ncbi:DUF4349 domain-containing protein [Oceanobacillus arenosus]|uniref:DUF4349 domain-containing protein n=1 Tax=Oceanobacillus arenosus TaxID=1229153 RepID=A0A3D8PZA4_9BACI|nr:DUF4349 domain-containing protein [Oceanobacillus arenosus]RDW21313.1 DUF4349 domain-containing protein [Oceanobacillus arenosus]